MTKYIAKMKNSIGEFDYSLEARDLFEADERFKKIAKSMGWTYISIR